MIPLPRWMRGALFATAVMNILATGLFLPAGESLRVMAGFPEGAHPFYLSIIAMFVLAFGLAYLWAAATGRAEHLFIALAAGGKLSFFFLLVGFWVVGAVPIRAPGLAAADLIFAVMFLTWLFGQREHHFSARRSPAGFTPR